MFDQWRGRNRFTQQVGKDLKICRGCCSDITAFPTTTTTGAATTRSTQAEIHQRTPVFRRGRECDDGMQRDAWCVDSTPSTQLQALNKKMQRVQVMQAMAGARAAMQSTKEAMESETLTIEVHAFGGGSWLAGTPHPWNWQNTPMELAKHTGSCQGGFNT